MVKVDGVSYRVTSIADNAFKNNKKITRVVIGSNIVTIGKNAFAKCTNITSIVVGKNVTKIEKNAFYGCGKLEEITIQSEKLTSKSITKYAFRGISKKTVVKVPASKYKAYKKMFYAKGLNKKVRILNDWCTKKGGNVIPKYAWNNTVIMIWEMKGILRKIPYNPVT